MENNEKVDLGVQINKCKANFCNCNATKKGYCERHYAQMQRHGEIKKTYMDGNDIVLYDNYAEIILCDKNNLEVTKTIIDLNDVERCKKYHWYFTSVDGYAKCRKLDLSLHRFVMMEYEKSNINMVIDHIDMNRLNNQKYNLRFVDKSINAFNTDLYKNNTSGCRGVCWSKSANKWECKIMINGELIRLGFYSELHDAIISRLRAEKELLADNAPQKHLFEQYNI